MTDHEKAYWIADKIVALGDYAKEAAMLLRKQADELTAIKKQEPVAWMRNNTLWSVVKVQQHYPDDGWPYQPLCLCTAPKPEELICPSCNVNREIHPCPAINGNCPMEGEAAAPKPEEE